MKETGRIQRQWWLAVTAAVILLIAGRLTFIREASVPDTHLQALVLKGVTTSGNQVTLHTDQLFQTDAVGYTVTMPQNVKSIIAIPTSADKTHDSIVMNGKAVKNGQSSQPIAVKQGSSTRFGISIVSKKPFSSHTYNFTAYRESESDHYLHQLSLGSVKLGTKFSPKNLSYSAKAGYDQSSINITAVPLTSTDKVTINYDPTGPKDSKEVKLTHGWNQIAVEVAAKNSPSTVYNLNIYRYTSDELKSLAVQDGTIVRPFAPDSAYFEVDVPHKNKTFRLIPTAFEGEKAKITVNGKPVKNGKSSQPIALKPGNNAVKVEVDGMKRYNVTVYRQPSAAGVTMYTSGSMVTLRNSKLAASFDKHTSQLTELHQTGEPDMLGKGVGYLFLNPGYVSKKNDRFHMLGYSPGNEDAVFHIASQSSSMIDIYFTYDSVSYDRKGPFDWELHFVLRKGQSGFYSYIVAKYPPGTKTPGMEKWTVGQVRWSIRADAKKFTYVQNEGGPAVKLPNPKLVQPRDEVMNATTRLPSGGAYTKYDMVNSEAYTHLYGLLGDKYGLWFMKGGNDYTNGLPAAKEIGAHQTGSTPIINWAPEAAHYGRSPAQPNPGWSHIWGPIFVYVNHGHGKSGLYKDAEKHAQTQEKQWPYPWLTSPVYAVKDRGTVAGQLIMKADVPEGGATVLLAQPGGNWQRQGNKYVYYTKTDASGHFTMKHVRAGSYALYAYTKGAFGQFEHDHVMVKANQTNSLGKLTWIPEDQGHTLWEIGTPDRSASEYLQGNKYKQWGLWLRYPFDFPNGVNYYVGKSNYKTDWNYAQPLNKTPGQRINLLAPFSNDPAVWKVHFNMKSIPSDSKGRLVIAIAARRDPDVKFELNGTELYEYKSNLTDSAFPRSGISGDYVLLNIPFKTSVLKKGENTLSLVPARRLYNSNGQRMTDNYSSIMYDSLKMMIIPQSK